MNDREYKERRCTLLNTILQIKHNPNTKQQQWRLERLTKFQLLLAQTRTEHENAKRA